MTRSARSSTASGSWWPGLVALVLEGCVGLPPPPPLRGTTSDADATTSMTTTAGDGTAGDGTAVDLACGNGVVDPEEACDTDDLQDHTCESLGLPGGELRCTGCRLDAEACAPPPGMVLVPGGAFTMGADSAGELPIRSVTVSSFWVDETEVTVTAYEACVVAGACDEPPTGATFNHQAAGREDHPINGVNWFDADVYCRWVDGGTKRLPTEAEWEKAARGPVGFAFPWGNAAADCTRAVMADATEVGGCGTGTTAAVGSKPLGLSDYGVLDMAGNVQEWVSDWYGDYDSTQTLDPVGPATGSYRVLRGGAWDDLAPTDLRATERNLDEPADHTDTVGFRCVRPTAVEPT